MISGWAPWAGPALVAALAFGLRLGALLVHRHLTFDDGCYAVSTIDMRHGLLPFRDLFSSQGPLHYPLLYAGDLLTFRPLNGPRVVPVLSGIVASVGVWAIARRLGTAPRSALFAGAVVASSGALLWATGPVSGDGPAVALAVCAVWAAARHRDRRATWCPLVAGALFGAALAVKAIVFPFAIPIAWLLWGRRRVAPLAVAVATTIAVWFAAALPWGMTRVWNQSIAFHFDKHANGSPLEQFGEVVAWLVQRDILLSGALLLAVLAAIVLPRWRLATVRDRDVLVIGLWAASTVLVLVFERLLLQLHLAGLVPPLALLLALRPPPLRWLALALVALVPLQAVEIASVVVPRPYRGADAELVGALRALPHGSLVISDVQGYVWQSGHSTPRMLNDNSTSRIEQRQVTTARVAAAAALPKTCAVVIASYRFDKRLPGLRAALAQDGYSGRVFARAKELWTKRGCATSNAAAAREIVKNWLLPCSRAARAREQPEAARASGRAGGRGPPRTRALPLRDVRTDEHAVVRVTRCRTAARLSRSARPREDGQSRTRDCRRGTAASQCILRMAAAGSIHIASISPHVVARTRMRLTIDGLPLSIRGERPSAASQ